MTVMYDNVHICTYSMQLEAPGGYLCPRWYIIAFQMEGKHTNLPTHTAKERSSTDGVDLFMCKTEYC